MTKTDIAAVAPPLSGARHAAHIAFGYLVGLFSVGVVAQVFLAGAGVFGIDSTDLDRAASFDPHRIMGNALGIFAGVLLLLALVARRSPRIVVGALVLVLLTVVAQHGLANAGVDHRWMGALHAADGAIILLLGSWLAVSTWPRRFSA